VPAPAERDLSMDFDLGGISLDLNTPAPAAAPQSVSGVAESLDLPDIGDGSADPFERKLELAEEFRQIGDLDGARDLLNEVIEQTGGAIQAKARSMLDRLA
jgi:pilus assembly protein FimV